MSEECTESAGAGSIDKESICWKIFSAKLNKFRISITDEEARQCCASELKIPEVTTPPGFYEYVPAMLRYSMTSWRGFDCKAEVLTGKWKEENCFQTYKKNIEKKMMTFQKIFAQGFTDGVPEGCPFKISITCPVEMLNTFGFVKVKEDVIMKQHSGSPCRVLTDAQLVNWPQIEVTFQTHDLFFVRKQATKYVRFLDFSPHTGHEDRHDVIEEIQSYGQQNCYSTDYFEQYIKTYVKSLKTVPEIKSEKLMEIETILDQFIEDIKHININESMVTNTAVVFRTSHAPFSRNKKLVKPSDKGDENPVWYCEIITPRTQLMIVYFKAEQVDSKEIRFVYTDNIKGRSNPLILPNILYKCSFCKAKSEGEYAKQKIIQHIVDHHKLEEPVRCTICKKQFEFLNLAASRWKHPCTPCTVDK